MVIGVLQRIILRMIRHHIIIASIILSLCSQAVAGYSICLMPSDHGVAGSQEIHSHECCNNSLTEKIKCVQDCSMTPVAFNEEMVAVALEVVPLLLGPEPRFLSSTRHSIYKPPQQI